MSKISDSVPAKWGLGKRRRKTDRDKYMTPEEVRRFLAGAKKEGRYWYCLFAIAANVGLRITEAVTLTRAAFSNIDENIVLVASLKQKNLQGGEKPVDVVYVDDGTKAIIKKYLDSMDGSSEYLFPNGDKPVNRTTAWRTFYRITIRAGLSKSYSPHALRHSRGVALWDGTKDLQFVRAQLRHRSLGSTSKYMHMSPKTQMALTRKVKSVL